MKRILPWAMWFVVGFAVVMAFPAACVVQGYRLAREADRRGIELKIHHGGASIGANPKACRGEMTFDRPECERLGRRDYVGGPFGLVTLFQGWGTSLYHVGR